MNRVAICDGFRERLQQDGSDSFARLRFVVAALTGNLVRSKIYTRTLVSSVSVFKLSDNETRATAPKAEAKKPELKKAEVRKLEARPAANTARAAKPRPKLVNAKPASGDDWEEF